MNPLHQKYDFFVYPQEIDGASNLRLSALECAILNTAGLAAEDNGFGAPEMIEQGVTWVLSRLAIEMKSLPKQYEQFSIETWVEDYGRLLTTRHFNLFDKTGNTIGHACSLWALIDVKNRRPVNLQTRPDLARFASGEVGMIEKPGKIDDLKEGQKAGEHIVAYSDLDYNNHTNSMKYVDWMADVLPLEVMYEKKISRFEINYLHEARYGETIEIFSQQEGNTYLFDLVSSEGRSLCKAKFQFEA